MQFKTRPEIKRHSDNPVLSMNDTPYPACLVFNAGVAKFKGRYVMVFRNDMGDMKKKTLSPGPCLGIAFSDDGVDWNVEDRFLFPEPKHPLYRAYDPRLTVIENRLYMCFALGAGYGTCGGIAVTDDLLKWEFLGLTAPDNRNMVLFPEKINDKFVRLERPFAGYLRPGDHFDMWLSESPDCANWGRTRLVLAATDLSWVNDKVGPGAPPVKTDVGWLAIIHAVDQVDGRNWGWSQDWNKRYSGALALLDLEDPSQVIGLSDGPVLVPEPEYDYESDGYRPYVAFPGGMVLEDSGEVKMYYGSADTVECLATAQLDDLLAMINPFEASDWPPRELYQ
jgi:beta-1,4-mannooligosaccharide/beta-1,4-mannosyl-N-acetylglucosamine phosphorylase